MNPVPADFDLHLRGGRRVRIRAMGPADEAASPQQVAEAGHAAHPTGAGFSDEIGLGRHAESFLRRACIETGFSRPLPRALSKAD